MHLIEVLNFSSESIRTRIKFINTRAPPLTEILRFETVILAVFSIVFAMEQAITRELSVRILGSFFVSVSHQHRPGPVTFRLLGRSKIFEPHTLILRPTGTCFWDWAVRNYLPYVSPTDPCV